MTITPPSKRPSLRLSVRDNFGSSYACRMKLPIREVGGAATPGQAVLSSYLTLLLRQVLELRVDVAMLKGESLEEALEEAFLWLDMTPDLAEMLDNVQQAQVKSSLRSYFMACKKASL